ncbi:MAG: response regulator transcription factor [Caulobacteraceae bacterium]|nr:MAG: response regulator transcription factor [Caulobacteraceae bacterium]
MASDESRHLARSPRVPQRARDGRAASSDGGGVPGTSGSPPGTGGWQAKAVRALTHADARDLRLALYVVSAVTSLVVVVNALTSLADIPDIRTWEPWAWELSSAVTIIGAIWIPWLAVALAPPDAALAEGWRPKAGFLAVHAIGLILLSTVHVVGFVWIRRWIYDLMGAGPYVFGDRFIYELRKDGLSYLTFVATFSAFAYLRRRRDEPVRPVSFDIRDGARIIRAPLSGILAVSSAGNYVEFHLADGRRPLMRATLAAIEVELDRFGFVRAHRSWLLNASRVTGLEPAGSGDWLVQLGAIAAPLSRRYPLALELLLSGDKDGEPLH